MILCPPPFKKWGGHVPPSPPLSDAHEHDSVNKDSKRRKQCMYVLFFYLILLQLWVFLSFEIYFLLNCIIYGNWRNWIDQTHNFFTNVHIAWCVLIRKCIWTYCPIKISVAKQWGTVSPTYLRYCPWRFVGYTSIHSGKSPWRLADNDPCSVIVKHCKLLIPTNTTDNVLYFFRGKWVSSPKKSHGNKSLISPLMFVLEDYKSLEIHIKHSSHLYMALDTPTIFKWLWTSLKFVNGLKHDLIQSSKCYN